MVTYLLQGPATVRLLSAFILLFAVGTAAVQDGRAAAPNPALLDLVRETLDRNPGVLAAKAAVDAAEARVRGAGRPLYNPQLEMDAEQSETRVGSLGLSQAIDWTDKRGARTGVADASLSAVRAEYMAIRQQLGGELLASLGRYQTAQSLRQLADQRVALMQRFLDLAEKRRQAGDLSQVELDLARLAHTQATLQLSQTHTLALERDKIAGEIETMIADLHAKYQELLTVSAEMYNTAPAVDDKLAWSALSIRNIEEAFRKHLVKIGFTWAFSWPWGADKLPTLSDKVAEGNNAILSRRDVA